MTGLTESADAEDLPDDAVVIRGGAAFDRQRAWLNAMDAYERLGFYGLCVASRAEMSDSDLAERWNYSGKKYRSSTVGAIRNLGDGFDVVVDDDTVHSMIKLPRVPDDVWAADPMWDQVASAFPNDPKPNPGYVE